MVLLKELKENYKSGKISSDLIESTKKNIEEIEKKLNVIPRELERDE